MNSLGGFGGLALWKVTEAFSLGCPGLRTWESVALPWGLA